MSKSVIWGVDDYCKAIKDRNGAPMSRQVALRRLKSAHAEALADGRGGWLFRVNGGHWRINMVMLAKWKPGMLVAPSLEDRVEALEFTVARVESKFDRLAASVRHVDANVKRISSRPPATV